MIILQSPLPSIFNVFAEGKEVVNINPLAVVKYNVALPVTENLVAVHSAYFKVDVGMVVDGGCHGHIESAVLGNEFPRLKESALGATLTVTRSEMREDGTVLVRTLNESGETCLEAVVRLEN